MKELTDISTRLSNYKLARNIQSDMDYFNSVAPLVFTNPTTYTSFQSDVAYVASNTTQLFSYFSPDPSTQSAACAAMNSALAQTIKDTTALIGLIPSSAQAAMDLNGILNTVISDCQALQAAIPSPTTKE